MTTETPVPRFEHFTVTYPSGTVVTSFYADGATLEEVRVTHPLAVVEAVGDSLAGFIGKHEVSEHEKANHRSPANPPGRV